MRILLACNAGMSTSMLVEKMKKISIENGEDHTIWATNIESVKNELDKADVILLGPQVRLELKNIQDIAGDIPVDVIRPTDYGRQDGSAVIEYAKIIAGRE